MEDIFIYHNSIAIVKVLSLKLKYQSRSFPLSWLKWMLMCVRLYFGFKVAFYNLDKFICEVLFKPQKRSFTTGIVQNLASGWSLSVLLVATEHSSDTYTGPSVESLISKCITFSSLLPLVLWMQKVRHLAGRSARCQTWRSSHFLLSYCSSAPFSRTALDNQNHHIQLPHPLFGSSLL